MSTRSPTPDWRAVLMRNTLREIRSLLGIAAVLGAGAVAAVLLSAPLPAQLLAAAALMFLAKAVLNGVAYRRSKRAATTGAALEGAEAVAESSPTDVVREIELGGTFGRMRFVHDGAAAEAVRHCADAMHDAVSGDTAGFVRRFQAFVAECCADYPEHARELAQLLPAELHVFRHGKSCDAFCYFQGAAADIWYARFDGREFVELIWIR